MKITNLQFDEAETGAIHALAGQALKDRGVSRKAALERIEAMTPQNILRIALGLPIKKRGGRRKNAGRPEGTKEKPE